MSQLTLHEQLTQLRDALLSGLIEREVPVRLALLAAICGEHILLIGPPGTAKSEIARRLRHAFRDASFFERLLTRFSVPEELFGPLSIKGLEQDRYERQLDGYLPTAHIAFIDEIFKANSAILNALLTLLNERRFDQGSKQIPTPLICAIGASNEYPEGEELEALYDRFLLRYHVEPVSDAAFISLLELEGGELDVSNHLKLTHERVKDIQKCAQDVIIPKSILDKLSALRLYLNSPKASEPLGNIPEDHPARNFYISDRRWRKITHMLKVSAHTNGRDEVNDLDTLLLIDVVWNLPQQRKIIKDWISKSMGAESINMPENIMKLISTYKSKCDKFESFIQKTDKDGNLLYLGDDNKEIAKSKHQPPPQRHKKNEDNEYLYEIPDNFKSDNYMTKKELESVLYSCGLIKNGQRFNLENYTQKYAILEPYPPCMIQQMASKIQINHICNQLSKAAEEARLEKAKIQNKLDEFQKNYQNHIWIY
jgi:MoxR-like ATPase